VYVYRVNVRWQRLFADLSAQWEEAEASAEWAESASRARAEFGAVLLADRLRGAEGARVVLRCRGAGRVAGEVTGVGPDWVLLADERGAEVLVAGVALVAVTGLGRVTAPPAEQGAVRGRLDLRRAVRWLARDRSPVRVVLADGAVLTGTIDRVGADFCEVAEHALDEARRGSAVQGVTAVALAALAVVRTAVPGLG
jgi:hypothetical protein